MLLSYKNKKSVKIILSSAKPAELVSISGSGTKNRLFQGDNLPVLKKLLDDYEGKIDLVYIDPPFSTNGKFNIGADRANTVSSCRGDDVAYYDTLLGEEYLEFLRERLVFLRELMSERGSIYLHIDYKIGHYVKVLMDEIFGRKNFRNDITRIKCNPKNFNRKAYGNVKDLILFYSKTDKLLWNKPFVPYSEEEASRLFKKIDASGRRYTTIPLHAPGETSSGETGGKWKGISPPKGRHWRTAPEILEEWDRKGLIEWSARGVPRKKIHLDESEGKMMQDIWKFKDPQHPEYPTEKNLEMLKFIVQASSNKNSIVLDCFCGSGTTLIAAQLQNRNWLGIDKSEHAIRVAKKRLESLPENLFSDSEYEYLMQKNIPLPEQSAV